jgi:hypothetical protein
VVDSISGQLVESHIEAKNKKYGEFMAMYA